MVNFGGQELSMGELINFGFPAMAQIGKYALYVIIVAVAYYIVWIMMSYKYKLTIFEVVGGGGNTYTLGKIKSNRAKVSSSRNYWQTLYPWGNKKHQPCFPAECIYAGNKGFAYEYDGRLIPITIERLNENHITNMNAVSKDIAEFEALELQSNEQEFRKMDKWTENKATIIVLAVAIICLIMVLGTIYMAFQFSTNGWGTHTSAIQSLGDAIKNANVIPQK